MLSSSNQLGRNCPQRFLRFGSLIRKSFLRLFYEPETHSTKAGIALLEEIPEADWFFIISSTVKYESAEKKKIRLRTRPLPRLNPAWRLVKQPSSDRRA